MKQEQSGGLGGPIDSVRDLELELMRLREVAGSNAVPVATLFFGGGTPTLLAPEALGHLVDVVRDQFGLESDAEVTTEANPETLDRSILARLREVGFNRLSIGLQSAVGHVLQTLGREHDADRGLEVVRWARQAGFDNISLDLIYGSPGESLDDWRRSVDAAIDVGVNHVSAYALKIEPGTAMGARRRRGELLDPSPDDLADRYELADEAFSRSGRPWYEISNWAQPGRECRHNLGYWRGDDWLGVGPGAHSHVAGVRWWNVKRPRQAAELLADGRLPIESGEVLSRSEQEMESVMLGIRLRDGIEVPQSAEHAVCELVVSGLLDPDAAAGGRAIPTRRGRLLADVITRGLAG